MQAELIAGVTFPALVLIWVGTIGAAVLRAFTGFGFALAAVPIFSLFLSPGQAVVLSACLSLALGVQTYPQYAHHLNLSLQWPVFASAILAMPAGIVLLTAMESAQFQLAIGIVTVASAVFLSRFHPRPHAPGWLPRLGAGSASGLCNGAFAIPGPPIIVYIMATEADPGRSRAFMIGFFSITSLFVLIGFALAGLVSLQSLWLFLLVFPAMFIGDRLGYRLFRQYGGGVYRKVSIAALLLLGISIGLKGWLG